MIKWIKSLFNRTKWHTFDYKGNTIKSNKPEEEVLKSLDYLNDSVVTIIYADGQTKTFAKNWFIFGDGILKNCKKIKVVL